MDVVVYSFHQPDRHGGMFWWADTAETRAEAVKWAMGDAERDRIVVAFTLRVPPGLPTNEITDILDSDPFYESGQVGRVLYRSPGFEPG